MPTKSLVASMYNTEPGHLSMVENLFLDGLIKYGGGSNTQLILLDDMSPLRRDTVGLIERLSPELKRVFGEFQFILNERNLGFARSYNRGLSRADGDVVGISNTDVRLTPGSLDSMIGFLDQGYGLVTPVTNSVGDAQQRVIGIEVITDYTRKTMNRIDEFSRKRRPNFEGRTKEVKFPMAMFWVIPKEVKDEVGLFDERFKTAFWEDTDYGVRVREHGYKSGVDLSSFVYHGKANEDLTKVLEILKYPFKIEKDRLIFFKNMARFIKKHGLSTFLEYLKEVVFTQ